MSSVESTPTGRPVQGLDDHRVARVVLEHALGDVGQALVGPHEQGRPRRDVARRLLGDGGRAAQNVAIGDHSPRVAVDRVLGIGPLGRTTIACTCSLAIRWATVTSGVSGVQVSTRGRIASATRAWSKVGVR